MRKSKFSETVMSHCSAEDLRGLKPGFGDIDSPAVLDAFSFRLLLAGLVGCLTSGSTRPWPT